jgi:F-type H+-transporting ATPase subunit a
LGFVLHGAKYFGILAPEGVPKVLMPFLVFLELISYLIRPISLAIRLFANMLAGHTLIKVLAGLIGVFGAIVSPLIIPMNALLTGLELVVAVLQAYIFAVLTCVYLDNAIHLH